MICTECTTDDGVAFDPKDLKPDAVKMLCEQWKCSTCMNAMYQAEAEKLAAFLLGTCSSEVAAMEQLEIDEGSFNDSAFCARFDELIHACSTCGWWFEPCDLDDADDCPDCRSDEDED